MRKLALLLTLFIGAATVTQAQDRSKDASPYAAAANAETEKLDKIVQLTEAQKEQIYKINVSLAERTAILASSDSPDKESLTKEVETYRARMYKQTLTPEQAKKYEAAVGAK